MRRAVQRELHDGGVRPVVLSRERFVGDPFNSFLSAKQNAEALREFFPKARVLIVIRRQDEFSESVYKQSLHQGHSLTPNRFLSYSRGKRDYVKRPLQTPGINIRVDLFDWLSLVTHYHKLFGRENVTVIPYELLRDEPGRFLAEIDQWAGRGLARSVANGGGGWRNRGYSLPSSYIALVLNRFLMRHWNSCGFIPEKPFVRSLSRAERRGPGRSAIKRGLSALSLRALLQNGLDRIVYIPGRMIREERRNEIMAVHAARNRELADLVGWDLERWGYH